jgi:uncharacterized protein with GYD domain
MIEAYYPIVEQFEAMRIKFLELNYTVGSFDLANVSNIIHQSIEQLASIQVKERTLLHEISKQLKVLC